MITVGSYVRKKGERGGALWVVGLLTRLPSGAPMTPAARCRFEYPPTRAFPPYGYVTLPVSELEEVGFQPVCAVCKAPATLEDGKVSTRFICARHARSGDRPIKQ